jgi:hypothetical protein
MNTGVALMIMTDGSTSNKKSGIKAVMDAPINEDRFLFHASYAGSRRQTLRQNNEANVSHC